jgi:hypothetical protein
MRILMIQSSALVVETRCTQQWSLARHDLMVMRAGVWSETCVSVYGGASGHY